MESTNTYANVGSVNDAGMLRNLFRNGFTPFQCLGELVSNSHDAGANILLFGIGDGHIRLIDDGRGMTRNEIVHMWDMNRENHAGKTTHGVSGVGGKAATTILSGKKTVFVYTKSNDDQYYTITVPWDNIYAENRYIGMIKIRIMTADEILCFQKERENMVNKLTGVTICFNYTDKLATEIENQFIYPNESVETQLSYIHGLTDMKVYYNHFGSVEQKQMQKYNYFGEEDNHYYTGVSRIQIRVYNKKGENRFIYDGNDGIMEVKIYGKGYTKTPEVVTESLEGWKHIGDFTLLIGCRRDPNYFSETSTEMPHNADDVPLEYEKGHFGLSKHPMIYKPQLVRNDQPICSLDLPDVNISSRRGGPESMFKFRHLKSQLKYSPVSHQDNPLDRICEIQENKNQCLCKLPVHLSRIIQQAILDKSSKIWSHFTEIVKHNTVKQPAVESESDEELIDTSDACSIN